MPILHFHGEVQPSVARISVSKTPQINWEVPERDLSVKFSIQIEGSRVHIVVDANRYSPEDLTCLYMRAFDLARAAVNLAAFSTGSGVSVMLSTFTGPDGVVAPLLCHDDKLAALCTSFDLTRGFADVLGIVSTEPSISALLNELIASITMPHVSVANCARVIDGIKNLIAPNLENDAQKWKLMHDTLRLDPRYLKLITHHSNEPGHGVLVCLDGETTNEICLRSWTIMNRFLEYRKRARCPLPESEFPVLFGYKVVGEIISSQTPYALSAGAE